MPFTKNAFVIAIPVVIIFAVVILSHIKRKETPKAVGWNFVEFFETLKLLAIPTLIFCVILVLVGWLAGSLRFHEVWRFAFLEKCLKVFIGAMLQQHLIQAFFDRRAEMIWEKGNSQHFYCCSDFFTASSSEFVVGDIYFCGRNSLGFGLSETAKSVCIEFVAFHSFACFITFDFFRCFAGNACGI